MVCLVLACSTHVTVIDCLQYSLETVQNTSKVRLVTLATGTLSTHMLDKFRQGNKKETTQKCSLEHIFIGWIFFLTFTLGVNSQSGYHHLKRSLVSRLISGWYAPSLWPVGVCRSLAVGAADSSPLTIVSVRRAILSCTWWGERSNSDKASASLEMIRQAG